MKQMDTLPLAGVTVLELGTIIAGPFAGSLLADLGATVVKIETPGDGDGLRSMGPRLQGVPIWFGVSARGKKCVSLNLKSEAGRAVFERLIQKADVLIENYRPGVLDRLRIPVSRLQEINPALVVLSISGFGWTGPWSHRAGFGKIAEGLSGVVPLTGTPEQAPLFVGFSLADASAGLFGALAVNVALYARENGNGAHIDLALYEPLLRILDSQFAHTGDSKRLGTNDPYGWGVESRRSFPSVPCRDGVWIQVAIESELDRTRLAGLLGLEDNAAVEPRLHGWAEERLSTEVLDTLANAGIACVPVMDALQIVRDPYFLDRADVLPVTDPALGAFCVPGFYPSTYRSVERPAFRCPSVGQDNREVFMTLAGLSDAEWNTFESQGAF